MERDAAAAVLPVRDGPIAAARTRPDVPWNFPCR
jgi:hypothetical protein